MASRRVSLVACFVATALLGVAPLGASTGASRFSVPRDAAASARLHALASTTVAPPPTGPHSASLCWERDYNDPVGDAPIDARAYRLTYDCQTQTWRLGVSLVAPVQPAAFDSVAIEVDTDGRRDDGCDGFDMLAAGVFGAGNRPQGVLVATPTCDSGTWTTVSSAGFSATGTALALSFSEHALADATRLIWNAGVVPRDPAQPVDSLPDQGVLVAGEFLPATSAHDGYWLADAAGGVHAYGNATFHGDLAGHVLAQPVVAMARRNDRDGYWLLGRDGGVFTFGDARFYGSTGARHLNRPVVSMAATPNCGGYWVVASDGGIFAFGNAHFYGSTGAIHLASPIVGMAPTPSGHGYWLVASDGGIFAFGDAHFYGSTGARHLNRPIVGMASTPSGHGYWLVASDGGIFAFGDAHFYGSTGAIHLASPIVGMRPSSTGHGYRFVAADGGIFGFGDASFLGGLGGGRPPSPVVGIG